MNDIDLLHVNGGGINKPKWDPRRFSHKKAFGSINLDEVPDDFSLGEPLDIKNQLNSDMCSAFSSDGLSEYQEGVVLAPEYTFYKTKLISGNWKDWGADPDDVCKSHTRYGALEKKDCPFSLENNGRDFVANPMNWDSSLDQKALTHRKGSYFEVDGQGNLFDSIRDALYTSNLIYQKTKNPSDLQPVWVGANWQPEWTYAPMGIVPTVAGNGGSGHAFYFVGTKSIAGKVYLIAINSYGSSFGDGGKWYFPEEAVNRYFLFARVFRDFDPNNYKQQNWNIMQWAYDIIAAFSRWMSAPIVPVPTTTPQTTTVPETTEPTAPSVPAPHTSKIAQWANAIKVREGFGPNTRSFKNNNPGNLKFTTYTQSLGAIWKDAGGFCTFADYDAGFGALCQFLVDACDNKLIAFHDKTLLEFTKIYAQPPTDAYAKGVAKALSVDVNIKIKELA